MEEPAHLLGVLHDSNRNDTRTPEERDLAFAKALQDQENAWTQLASADDSFATSPPEAPAGSGAEPDLNFARRLQAQELRLQYMQLLNSSRARRRRTESQGAEAADEEEEDDTENGSGSDDDGSGYEDDLDPDEMTYEELQALADTVGVVSKGLSAGAIAALPAHTYSAPQMVTRSSTAQAESCAVCCEDLQDGESVKQLPCRHAYHAPCIDQWLVVSKACPCCGTELRQQTSDKLT